MTKIVHKAKKSATQLNPALYSALKELGLTEHEIHLYALTLMQGPRSISTLAREMGVSRPNVYKLISGLTDHKLVRNEAHEKYARTFMVEPPTVVLERLREQRERVAKMDTELVLSMPELLAQYHQGEAPTRIRVLQGREQYLKAFYETLDQEKDEIQFFGSETDFANFVSWDTELAWVKERVKRGIRMKLLLLPSEEADAFIPRAKEELRELRTIDAPIPFATAFQLYGNKVIIWQPKAPLAVLIEDEYIVKMLKSIFFIMWEKAGKVAS